MMPVEFPGSSLEHDSFSSPVGRDVMGRSQTLVGKISRAVFEQYLPSLTAASVVWCGHPVSTWTAGAPPQCRHTFPHYPGLNCTPAMIPLDLLATPEDK